MTIRGLPAHVLLVHLVVVLVPMVAGAAVAAAVWPAVQRKLTFLIPLAGWVAVAGAVITQIAGTSFADSLGNPDSIERHRELGRLVWPLTSLLALSATLQWWTRRRSTGGVRTRRFVTAAVFLSAAGAVAIVVLAADAGAHAVWAR